MNINRFFSEDAENTGFLVEASKVLNGAEVARELGISRVAVKKITQNAMTKLFNSVAATDPDLSPFQTMLTLATMLGVVDDSKGIVTIVRNISAAQKKSVVDDIKSKYPNYDVSKFGL